MSGSACDRHCAGRGIASKGNMKPDSRMFGRRKKNDICIACCWVRASVEKNRPSARLAAMNTNASAYSSGSEPDDRHVEDDARRRSRISVICT